MARTIKTVFLLAFLALSLGVKAQQADEAEIRNVLKTQAEAWNQGDIEAYMQGYWNSDSLLFVGKSGPTYGYRATLERYKKSYPDKASMGQLTFSELRVRLLSGNSAFVLGRWSLQREKDAPGGFFTLLWEKKRGHWVIVADHSS